MSSFEIAPGKSSLRQNRHPTSRVFHLLEIRLVLRGTDHSDVCAGDVVVRLARDEDHGFHGRVVRYLVRPDVLDLLPKLTRYRVHLLGTVDPVRRGRTYRTVNTTVVLFIWRGGGLYNMHSTT